LLARRVEADFAIPGWRVEALQWPSEASAVLALRGPAEARVEVQFTIGARGKRSTVGVELRSAEQTDDVKAVMAALVDLLRERPALSASPEHHEAIRA
jgi:hypothetical protein